jgi:dTDP-L-rhamnose 4-epimerase
MGASYRGPDGRSAPPPIEEDVVVRVLVTGGEGFIGSAVVDELVAAGCEVTSLDLLHPAAHRSPPGYLNPAARRIRADVGDAEAVAAALDGVDAVSHQASMVGLGTSFDDVADYVRHNSLATAVLLRGLHRAGFGGRLVLASSCVVYGEQTYRCPAHGIVRAGPRDEARLLAGEFDPVCPSCGAPLEPIAVTEDAPLDPRNVYAVTKVNQEHLCAAFARESGSPVTLLRYHNVYGPRMPRNTPYAGVASIFRSALEAGCPPMVTEDGRQLRDFVHVGDVARANLAAVTNATPAPGAFNVATGVPRSVGAMATALAAAFDGPRLVPEVTGSFRLGDVRHIFCSPVRAADALGWRAGVSFEEGMAEFAHAPLRG